MLAATIAYDILRSGKQPVSLVPPNRHGMKKAIEQLHDAGRHTEMMPDIGSLKQVNDGYGQVAGDSVIQMVAAELKKATRGGDVVARVGGDGLIVIPRNMGDAVYRRVDMALYEAKYPEREGTRERVRMALPGSVRKSG